MSRCSQQPSVSQHEQGFAGDAASLGANTAPGSVLVQVEESLSTDSDVATVQPKQGLSDVEANQHGSKASEEPSAYDRESANKRTPSADTGIEQGGLLRMPSSHDQQSSRKLQGWHEGVACALVALLIGAAATAAWSMSQMATADDGSI